MAVGRADRLRGVLASLYAGRVTAAILIGWFVATVAMTFLLPRLQRPGTTL